MSQTNFQKLLDLLDTEKNFDIDHLTQNQYEELQKLAGKIIKLIK